MARYQIVLSRSAERELQGLPAERRSRCVRAIDALAEDPRPRGVKKLRGARDLWRVRVGDYRIIYRIQDHERLVDISHIRHRKDAYL